MHFRDHAKTPSWSDDEWHLRRLLSLRHMSEHCYLYDDDGEMHCHTCDVDFKRDSVEEIDTRLSALALARFAEQQQHLDLTGSKRFAKGQVPNKPTPPPPPPTRQDQQFNALVLLLSKLTAAVDKISQAIQRPHVGGPH